jgi:hypothetical protein
MIETEDETKQKRLSPTKKRTIDVLESTVRGLRRKSLE